MGFEAGLASFEQTHRMPVFSQILQDHSLVAMYIQAFMHLLDSLKKKQIILLFHKYEDHEIGCHGLMCILSSIWLPL